MSRDQPESERSAAAIFADFVGRNDGHDERDLDRLCALHPELAAELRHRYAEWREILAGFDRSDSNLDAPPSPVRGGRAGSAASSARWDEFIEQLRSRGPTWTRFEDHGEVARGGMGSIRLVYDADLQRNVAMKLIRDAPGSSATPTGASASRGRFLEEAQITGQLDHPGIVPVHEIGLGPEGQLYFTMKLVKGEDLRAVFEKVRDGRDGWSLTRALNMLLRVCDALAFAHAKRVVHRDLKPANIMVGRFGETYVMDWGLARVLDSSHVEAVPERDVSASQVVLTTRPSDSAHAESSSRFTQEGAVVGTPHYMPPEQARGETEAVGPLADVYALGAMLYELFAGRPPHQSSEGPNDPGAVLARVLRGRPRALHELAPDTPVELIAICERAMARRPELRYAGVSELAEDLRAFLENRVVQAHRTGTWVELSKWASRNRLLVSASAALLVVVVSAAVISTVFAIRAASEAELAARREYRLVMSAAADAVTDGRVEAARGFLEGADAEASGWEREYLEARLDTALWVQPFDEHPTHDPRPAFDRHGLRGVSGFKDGSLVVWNASDGSTVSTASTGEGFISRLALSEDGGTVRVVGKGGKSVLDEYWVAEWSADTGRRLGGRVLPAPALAAAWSPDGERIAVLEADAMRIYDYAEWRLIAERPYVHRAANSPGGFHIQFDEDGHRLLYAYRSESAEEPGEERWSLEVLNAKTMDVLFEDSTQTHWGSFRFRGGVLCSHRPSFIKLQDLSNPASIASPVRIELKVDLTRLDLSPDGELLAGTGSSGGVRVWECRTGKLVAQLFGPPEGFWYVRFSRDGSRLVANSNGGALWAWDPAVLGDPLVLRGHRSYAYSAQPSPDGRVLFSLGWDGWASRRGEGSSGYLQAWDVDSGARIGAAGRHAFGTAIRWSPAGDRIAIADVGSTSRVRRLALLDARTARTLAELSLSSESVGTQEIAFDASGDRIAVASLGGLDLVDGRDLAVLAQVVEGQKVDHVVFSPDGSYLAWSEDARWVVADAASFDPILVVPHDDPGQPVLAFDPGSARIIVARRNGLVSVCGLGPGEEPEVFRVGSSRFISLAFHPDGSRFVTGDNRGAITVFDAQHLERICELRGHVEYVKELAFDSEGRNLYSASGDHTVKIWPSGSTQAMLAARRVRDAILVEVRPAVEELLDRVNDLDELVELVARDARWSGREREVALQEVLRLGLEAMR